MKRFFLLLCVVLFWASSGRGDNVTVVIDDSTKLSFTYRSAIDSAHLILIRGTVKDTFSLMPIAGSSHKSCDWEGVFNQVDSAGNYEVWIESYSGGAVIDTTLGGCQVELAQRKADMVKVSGDATAADNFETMLDGTGGQIFSLRGLHVRGTTGTDTAGIFTGYGNGHGIFAKSPGTGSGAYFLSVSGYGNYMWGGSRGLYAYGGNIGIKAEGNTDAGMFLDGQTEGLYSFGTTAEGIYAYSALSHGLQANGTGAGSFDIYAPNCSLNISGTINVATDVTNEVNVVSTDTMQANLIPADSTLIMDEIKNLNAWNPFVNVFSDSSADSIELMLANRSVLWGDTLTQLLVTIDSVITATGFDPDSTLLVFLQYIRNNQADYKADVSGLSTFDPATDTVAYVDSLIEELTITSVDSVRKVYILDSLDQTVTADVDSPMIARAVHFATTAAYGGSTGTMGEALVNAASCNPSGSNTIIIRLKRDSDSTAIIGHQVEVKTDGTTYVIKDTDNDGKIQFTSDNDTLFVYPHTHGITFNSPETLYIDGNEDTTYYGTPYSPSAPPADTLCVVYVYVKTNQGVAIQNAKVSIWGEAANVKYGNIVIDYQKKVTEKTGADGKAEFSEGFYPNDVLTPNNLVYYYRIKTSHFIAEGSFEVPIAASYELVIQQ